MNKILVVGAVILCMAVISFSQRTNIASLLLEKGLEVRINADYVAGLEDGLHLALCGAGGPMPAPNASGPCVAVVAGKRLFIIDAGTDGVRNLGRMGYQPGTIQGGF